MHAAVKTVRWFGAALGLLVGAPIVIFGLLQTPSGQAWLARIVAQAVSSPDFVVTIEGLGGIVPFRMTAERVEIADRDGIYLTARDFSLDISPAALLKGRLRIRWLSFAGIGMARLSTAPSTTPWAEYLKVPHVPIGVVVDRLSIDRLALAAPVLGENLVATVEASARLEGETARAALKLHRTDGTAGNIDLAMELAGATPTLQLQLEASEPTGVLLDRLLGRSDRPPLALSLNGAGPLVDWHGQLGASAGSLAHVNADLTLAIATEKTLVVSGSAAVAPLLPSTLAPLAGDRLAISMRARFNDEIVIDALSINAALGKVTGNGSFGGPNDAIAAHLRAEVPELSPLAGLLASPIGGSAKLTTEVSGTESRPQLELNLSGAGVRLGSSGAEHVEADVSVAATEALANPEARIKVAAQGRIGGLATPEGVAVPTELGRDMDWSLAAVAARDGSALDLTSLSAKGMGLTLTGAGRVAEGGQTIEGEARLSVADLRPFSGLAGYPLAGAIELEANAVQEGTAGIKAKVDGSAKGLRTGIAAADALLGDAVTITASMQRDPAGTLIADQFAITGAAASLSANARFDPASQRLAAAVALDVPQLKPLGPALGTEMRGAVSAHIDADGEIDHLPLKIVVEGSAIAAAGTRIDRLRLVGDVADLAEPKATIDGTYRTGGLDGTLSLAAELNGNSGLVLPRLRLTAADSAIDGSLRIALDTFLVRGSISGRARDVARLSQLAGMPLGGDLEFTAGLDDARGGQLLDLSLNGTRLAAGAGTSHIAIGNLAVKARFADILRAPSGAGRLSLTAASLGKAELATANLTIDTPRPGRFTFQADAKGRPLTMAFAGEGGLVPAGAELRLARLEGSLGSDRILLEQPLTLSKRGTDMAFSGLALDFGTGRIAGNGALRGQSVSMTMNAANLPIASAGRLLGFSKARGSLTMAATLGGTLHAPVGHVSMNAREVMLASLKHSGVPSLGIGVDGNWNGRNIDLKGQVTGLKEDTISFAGSAPLLLTPSPLGLSVPPDGRLGLQLRGAGQIEHLADLLPLGEDRVSGHFAANLAVGGTVAAPSANGRVTLSDARYENFATGAVLTNMQADLVGDRDRLTLSSFSAGDTADGSIKAQGNVIMNGPSGPSAELSATLAHFRVAARDEAVATASGTVSIAGPLSAPKVTAPITVDRADISLPSSLPPNVVVLKVIETGSKTGQPPPAQPAETPALPATLDIKVDMPGNIFVRGHALDSEWRGKLTITGTSAAPAISGHLEQINGSVDLLGKTFSLTRGTITFDGTAKLDPVLDIAAETSTTDITAQVNISGFASAPKITLTSTPVVPQDEILARVMFGKGVGQMTAGEGLQLAAAAASLAGGGPGMLDRLRSGIGLDYFKLGSGSTGATTGSLNPGATSNTATGGTALSAGKYIMPGVSVGVSQGVSPPTSKVTVQIEVRPHLTIGGEAGQSGSTGIGVNYNYDY
jgi:translocation and assembly module TamB